MSQSLFIPSTPRKMTLSITGRCNLACKYCFYANEMTALSDLQTETWLEFFDELGRLKVFEVILSGGEAFSRPDLFVLIDRLIENRMRYSILSNGTLITEKVLDQFRIGKRFTRLNYIQVSIDGSRAEIHNASRPNGFERAIRGLRLLKEKGFPVTVRVTINKHNLNDLEDLAALLLEDIGLASFSTNDAIPMGSGCQNEKEIALDAEEQARAISSIQTLLERYPGRLTAQAGPQAKLRMYAEMEHARRTGEKSTRWQMGYLSACGCTFSSLDILHDGTIVPCNMLNIPLGNITTHSIAEIWHNHPVLKAMRERRVIPMQEVPGCNNCQWTPYCNGSCPALPYTLYHDFNRANPHDCYRRFLQETDNVIS